MHVYSALSSEAAIPQHTPVFNLHNAYALAGVHRHEKQDLGYVPLDWIGSEKQIPWTFTPAPDFLRKELQQRKPPLPFKCCWNFLNQGRCEVNGVCARSHFAVCVLMLINESVWILSYHASAIGLADEPTRLAIRQAIAKFVPTRPPAW